MPKQNMHPEDVKAAVGKTGISLSELARRHSLNPSTVVHAVRRPQPSGNRVIAEHLKKKLHQLWPEWFDKDGNRITIVRKDTCGMGAKASQKRKVA
jgi:Ner family transcriptional regulator